MDQTFVRYTNVDYSERGGLGIEYTGTFGNSIKTGGLFYLSVGFESIYPETKRNEIMSKIFDL